MKDPFLLQFLLSCPKALINQDQTCWLHIVTGNFTFCRDNFITSGQARKTSEKEEMETAFLTTDSCEVNSIGLLDAFSCLVTYGVCTCKM